MKPLPRNEIEERIRIETERSFVTGCHDSPAIAPEFED